MAQIKDGWKQIAYLIEQDLQQPTVLSRVLPTAIGRNG